MTGWSVKAVQRPAYRTLSFQRQSRLGGILEGTTVAASAPLEHPSVIDLRLKQQGSMKLA